MKRFLGGGVVGILIGLAAGFALGIFWFPYIFPPPAANQQLADRASRTTAATGTFIHHQPWDPVHWGKGGVTLLTDPGGETVVVLEPDFEVGPGPAYHVYLVEHAAPRSAGEVTAAFLDLGPLLAFKGSQIHAVPSGTDLARYKSVVIWCRVFEVLISPATLERPPAAKG